MTLTSRRPGATIAVGGYFNPLIIQPDWLLAQNLIDEVDRDAVLETEDLLISPELSSLTFERFRVEILRDGLRITSREQTETPDQLFELAFGILNRLGHTPLFGFSHSYFWHFDLPADRWAKLQAGLWRPMDWNAMPEATELASLSLRSPRSDELRGETVLTVEPSGDPAFRGFFGCSDQVDVDVDDEPVAAGSVLQAFESVWAGGEARAMALFELLTGGAE